MVSKYFVLLSKKSKLPLEKTHTHSQNKGNSISKIR